MEGLFDFLADHYIWFAGISVFFAFALLGLVYETKKKKKAEANTADAVAQPVQAQAAPQQAVNPGVVVAQNPNEQQVVANAPSLAGLEANTNNFNNGLEAAPQQAQPLPMAPEAAPVAAPVQEPAQSAEPTLVIEDPATAPVAPAAPAEPVQPQTLGNPGQPPM